MPTAPTELTAQVASGFVTGTPLTSGVVPLSATMLAKAVLRDMIMTQLKWIGMTLAAVTLAAGAGVLTFAASRSQDPALQTSQPSQPEGGEGSAAGPVRSHADLLSAQARVSQKAYEQALATRNGKFDVDKVHLWSQRLMQAQIATAEGSYVADPKARAVCVAAAKAHRDRMSRLEEQVRAFVKNGTDLPLSISTAEYYRIEADGLVMEYDRGSESSSKVK